MTTAAEKEDSPASADFETAISATGIGKYNLLLILVVIPSGWANCFESTTMSFVFPAAQCDLNLTLEDKGLLNAITYSGMISSAVLWGFIFDTLGRKKLLTIGFFLDFVCVLISSFSQTKSMLIASKFFGGFIINGPYSALPTYISEFHNAKNRGRMQLCIAFIVGSSGLILPLLSWAVLSQDLHFSLFGFQFHSWNTFLLIVSLPPLASGFIFYFMPESPKFLMTVGQNEKALSIFQRIYSVNTRRPSKTFPVSQLVDEIALKKTKLNQHGGQITAKRTQAEALREGWQQLKPLFFPPHLKNILLVCLIQALFTMSVNTLRLWWPQIFQALNDYQQLYATSSVDLCQSLEMIRPSNSTDKCAFNMENSSVYINNVIIHVALLSCDLLVGLLINTIGKKKLLFILGILAGVCSFTIYFSTNAEFVVAFASLYTATSTAAANVVIVVIIDLFPTELRTMSISLALMCGRIGSMVGNLLFPMLVAAGCAPPFFLIGALLIGCAFLSLTLPNTELKALE